MKQYYELYTLENSLERMEKLLRTIAEDEDKPSVYEKTKKRYARIESSLKTCLKYVQEIELHYDIQVEHPDRVFEPDYTNSSIRSEVSTELEDRLKRIESKLFTSEDDEYYPELDTLEDTSCDEDTLSEDGEKIYDCTINQFNRIFEKVSNIDEKTILTDFSYCNLSPVARYEHPIACAKLIYRWFHTRFVVCRNDPKFHFYQYKTTITKAIKGIILGYAHWAKENKHESFEREVESWCSNLILNKSSQWGCPKIVTYYYKLPPHKSFSLEAAGIYETLWRLGYEYLSEQNLYRTPEFILNKFRYTIFDLSSDLIVSPQILADSEDRFFLSTLSSDGYSALMESCPIFVSRNSSVDSIEENHYVISKNQNQERTISSQDIKHSTILDNAYRNYRRAYYGIDRIVEIDEEDYEQWFIDHGFELLAQDNNYDDQESQR